MWLDLAKGQTERQMTNTIIVIKFLKPESGYNLRCMCERGALALSNG